MFGAVFVAELGDKTQLATLLFASDKQVGKWTVFSAASLALIAPSALGVLGGTLISQYVSDAHYRRCRIYCHRLLDPVALTRAQ